MQIKNLLYKGVVAGLAGLVLIGCQSGFWAKINKKTVQTTNGTEIANQADQEISSGNTTLKNQSGESETGHDSALWTYKSKKYPYQITYPLQSWVLKKNDSDNVEINYVSQSDNNEVITQCVITVTETKTSDLETALDEATLKSRFLEFTFIGGQKFAKLNLSGEKGAGAEYLTIYDKKLYRINLYPYPVKNSDEILANKLTVELDAMVQSWQFTEVKTAGEKPRVKL